MAKEFIIAIELGSSKITGVAGKKNADGSISIMAVAQERADNCIRKGIIYNLDKTIQCLTVIRHKLETALKTKISQVYVGVGGQSIRSVKNTIVKTLPPDTVVSKDMVDTLMDQNRSMTYTDQEILDAITCEYRVDRTYQIDPVGIQCATLEGNFLNILWRKAFYSKLNKCFDQAGITIAEMYLAPLALADSVLTEAERRSGCMLVDIGAETTTVSVYAKSLLRHLAVIPLGSANITRDIASLPMEESEAEAMKLKYASALTDENNTDNTLRLPIGQDRDVESRKFIEIVEARTQEIIGNAWNQVPNEYADKLIGGIILTGGGANMPNMAKAFTRQTKVEKIRVAKFVTTTINATAPEIKAHDGRMNTVLGLLEKGDMNCAGSEMTPDLFNESSAPATEPRKPVRTVTEATGRGVVLTEAEKAKLEEEQKRKAAEEAEAARLKAEEEERKAKEERRRNNILHKILNFFKSFFKTLTTPDEE